MTTSEISKLFEKNKFTESDTIIKMFTEGDLIKFARVSADIKLMEK